MEQKFDVRPNAAALGVLNNGVDHLVNIDSLLKI